MDGFNFNRKLFHLIGFFVPAILYYDLFKNAFELQYASRAILLLIVLAILIFISILEILRLNLPKFNDFYLKYFGKIMKEAEKTRMNGVVPYMCSNAIIVCFFPPQVIFLSMAYLLIGDPLAAFFGSKYGKYRFSNGKSLVGVVAFISSSIIAGIFLMLLFQENTNESLFSFYKGGSFNINSFFIILLGAIAAGTAEFLSGHAWKGFLEDNFLIPIVSSIVLTSLLIVMENSSVESVVFPITNLFNKI